MIIAGVDLGKSKAAFSMFEVIDGEAELAHVDALELGRTLPRTQSLAFLSHWVAKNTRTAEHVYVEEAIIGRSTRNSLHVAQTVGAVLASMQQKHVYEVPVATWKKEVIGKGNADKSTVSAWLDETYPAYASLCRGNQDAIDAVCLGLYGVANEQRAGKLVDDLR